MASKTAIALRIAAVAAGLAIAAPAAAQFQKPEDAVKYRQSAFTVMSNHMGRLAAMAKGERPFDAAAAQASARVIETMARLPWEAFAPATEGLKSGAKPALYQNLADLRTLADRLNGETGKLPGSVGDLDALRKQLGATGAACKACHDKYRVM